MQIFWCVMFIAGGIFMVINGIKGAINPREVREKGIREMEQSWYYTKTWLGRMGLRYEKYRSNGILDTKISSVVSILLGIVFLLAGTKALWDLYRW